MKKVLSLLIVLAMVISMVPAVFATEAGVTIVSQPESQSVTAGDSVVFSVEATGAASYQWQYKSKSATKWSNSSSKFEGYRSEAMTVFATTARSGTQYRCMIMDANGKKYYTDAATMTVAKSTVELVFTETPVDTTVKEGESTVFTVATNVPVASYQWQYRNPKFSAFTNCSNKFEGYQSPSVTVKGTAARDQFEYRCLVVDANGVKHTSTPVTFTVINFFAQQPVNQSVSNGDNVVFAVEARDGVSYQWQYLNKGATTWRNSSKTFEGYQSAAMTVPATMARSGMQYRCKVVDSDGVEHISNAAKLTVSYFQQQPVDQVLPLGSMVTMSVQADGAASYQWQYRTKGATTWNKSSWSDAKTNSITFEATTSRAGYSYRCLVTAEDGTVYESNPGTLYIGDATVILDQPADQTVSDGETATFAVNVSGQGLAYQWQVMAPGTSKWVKVSGATEATLSVEATKADNGAKYRCVITDKHNQTTTSNEVTLTVNSTVLEIVTQPVEQTVALGANAEFSVVATGDGLTYQWQTMVDDAWVNIADATAATLTVVASDENNNAKYQCVITDKYGDSVTTDAVELTVEYPAGHEKNPIWLEAGVNELNIPAGATVYYTGRFGGMEMAVAGDVSVEHNGATYGNGDTFACVQMGMWNPCVFVVTNSAEADAACTLTVSYPLGSMENPEIVTDLSFFYAPQAEGDTDGYFFKWTAPEAGILTLSLSNYAEGADYNAYVTVGYTQYNWAEEAVEGVLTIEVAEGDEVIINAFTISQYEIDENWNVVYDEEGNPVLVYNPESSVYINGGFVNGGINYPYDLSPENVPGSAVTNVIEAGASEYYTTTASGTVITFNTQDITVEYEGVVYEAQNGAVSFYVEGGFDPMTRMPKPIVFKVTNIGTAAASFTANYNYPVGHAENPDTLALGDNVAAFEQGDEPYYYTWTAEETGEVTITVSAENGWFYCVNNITASAYGDNNYYNDIEVVNTVTLSVEAGDVLQVIVSSYDADLWGSCDGSVTVNASFEAEGSVEIEQPLPSLPEDGEEN